MKKLEVIFNNPVSLKTGCLSSSSCQEYIFLPLVTHFGYFVTYLVHIARGELEVFYREFQAVASSYSEQRQNQQNMVSINNAVEDKTSPAHLCLDGAVHGPDKPGLSPSLHSCYDLQQVI